MIENGGRTERPHLEGLVHRARTELRDWTDAPESDPGVTLLELFALVGDLLSDYADRVADDAYLDSGHRHRPRRRRDLEVEVDGHPWRRVADLAESGPEDQHYLVSRRDDGASVIEFGDGVHGQRPPSGSSITVRYRHGEC